jgi:acylphosphatase
MAEVNAIVSGRVQGVGYRFFVLQKAGALGLKGFVKNCADGTVEVVAQGPREKIEMLLEELKKGPFVGRVDSVRAKWQQETRKFEGFEIGF